MKGYSDILREVQGGGKEQMDGEARGRPPEELTRCLHH